MWAGLQGSALNTKVSAAEVPARVWPAPPGTTISPATPAVGVVVTGVDVTGLVVGVEVTGVVVTGVVVVVEGRL